MNNKRQTDRQTCTYRALLHKQCEGGTGSAQAYTHMRAHTHIQASQTILYQQNRKTLRQDSAIFPQQKVSYIIGNFFPPKTWYHWQWSYLYLGKILFCSTYTLIYVSGEKRGHCLTMSDVCRNKEAMWHLRHFFDVECARCIYCKHGPRSRGLFNTGY